MMKRSLFLILAFGLIVLVVTGTLWAQVPVDTSSSDYATAENNGRRMVRDSEDTRHLVYEDEGALWRRPVMYTYSSDGVTWSTPDTIATGGSMGADANPSICIHDTSAKQTEVLHVVWSGPPLPDVTYGDIFYSSSVVGSGTWSTPINISNSPDTTSLLPAIAIDGSGGIHVVWQEEDFDIWYSYCQTWGDTFSTPINISNTPIPQSSERPSIANTIDYSSDRVHVVWYDYCPPESCGYPIPFIAYRNYHPATGWSPPLDSIPTDVTSGTTGLFPCISVGPDDNPHVVWDHGFSPGDVYHATSTDTGATFNPPVLVHYTTNPFPNASVANVSSESLHVVWSECNKVYYPDWYEVYHMVSVDDGATWTPMPPQLVSTGDEDWSQYPNLAYKMVLHDSCDIVWTDLEDKPYLVMYRRKGFGEEDTIWCYKPGYPDYAPSGMPDFDQKQDKWYDPQDTTKWTHCGPVAIANCLWWFDSKYQWLMDPDSPQPPDENDDFPLVEAYDGGDDHDTLNAIALVDTLAWYMDTDGIRTDDGSVGTNVFEMEAAIAEWLLETETDTIFYKHTKKAPNFYWIEEEIERCEDVILLLGFWQEPSPGYWKRIGGHYVTCAGVNSDSLMIAFSDPFYDNAEAGGLGRILDGILISHPDSLHASDIHNDAGNVSHDYYQVLRDSLTPGGPWSIPGYPPDTTILVALQGTNCPPEFDEQQSSYFPGQAVHTEIEYAVAISPVPKGWHYKGEYPDYAPDGMPDFDQNQHGWTGFCGPTAVANCLWWFDSKYQWLTDPGQPPPPYNYDSFDLVTTYNTMYDDHSYEQDAVGYDNVQRLIEDLAGEMGTGINGTHIDSMQAAIRRWLEARELDTVFYEHTLIDSTLDPDFFNTIEWEIEKCQDVILLLGFWENYPLGSEYWYRIGGHYVTCAGVCSDSMKIMFSDPDYDQQEITYPDSSKWHNNAALVSHDVYSVAPSSSPGGYWGLPDYPGNIVGPRHQLENCPDHLLPYEHYWQETFPIYTEIEGVVFISPFMTPAAVESLRIYPDGGPGNDVHDIRLRWSPVTTSYQGNPQPVDDYVVYRDTISDFTPGPAKVLTTTTATEYKDVNAAGNTAVNYFYIVTARKSGYESAPSGCVGEFDIDLGNGTKGRAREIRQSRPR